LPLTNVTCRNNQDGVFTRVSAVMASPPPAAAGWRHKMTPTRKAGTAQYDPANTVAAGQVEQQREHNTDGPGA